MLRLLVPSVLPSKRNYKETIFSLRLYPVLCSSLSVLSYVSLLYEYVVFAVVYLCCTSMIFIFLSLYSAFICKHGKKLYQPASVKKSIILHVVILCCILCFCYTIAIYLSNYLPMILFFLFLAISLEYLLWSVCAVVNYNETALLLSSALVCFIGGRYFETNLHTSYFYCALRIVFYIMCTRMYLGCRYVERFVFTNGS